MSNYSQDIEDIEIHAEVLHKKRRYKFTNKKHSREGIIATALGAVAAIFMIAGISSSYKAEGNGDALVAVLGLLAFVLSLYGFYKAIKSFKEEDKFYLFSWIGLFVNLATWVGIASILIMGI